jgi:HTH-type transcriptional regulator/antitoxin HigA
MEKKSMTHIVQAANPEKLPKTFLNLVALHVPRPIHDKVSYENTVELIDALAGGKLNEDQNDYLDVLSQLVESYEEENLKSFPKISGLGALKFLLSENEMGGDDLAKLLGIDRSVAYKILKGARGLTVEHIRKLCERFQVSADLFLA